jgi:uracil-DNA glycosylase family 4
MPTESPGDGQRIGQLHASHLTSCTTSWELILSFFFNEAKAEAKAKPVKKAVSKNAKDIPLHTLSKMGCSGCPRNADNIQSPKMKPSGTKQPSIYLLGGSPSTEDDELNMHWSSAEGRNILSKFGRSFTEAEIRSNYITQCHGDQTAVEIACCRQRIVADIEASRPEVIVTVGDAALHWVTDHSKSNALILHGRVLVARIGTHTCKVVPIIWPNYVHKNNGRQSPHENALEFDVRLVKDLVMGKLPAYDALRPYQGPYDEGITIITGQDPGDLQKLAQALKRIKQNRKGAIDIETNGFRPYRLKNPMLLTVAVGTFEDTVAFALDHPDGWQTAHQRSQAWDLFIDFLLTCGELTAHHVGMELEWLTYFLGEKVARELSWNCTMSMAHTLDERAGTKSLEVLSIIYFGFNLKAQSKVDPARLLEFPIRDVLRYNGMDTKWTDKLRDTLQPFIDEEPAYQAEHARKVRLAPTLIITAARGLPASLDVARAKSKALAEEVKALDRKIGNTPEVRDFERQFRMPFSASNPDHVLKMMREVLKREEVKITDKRTKVVTYSTGEEQLAAMPASEVPSAHLILEHRGVSKLESTYVQPVLSGKILDRDGRIRCTYSSMTAETGRLAADDPNLQNWPKRKFKHIREIIEAYLLALDYGQIEFRVVGMASEDENLVKACWTGYDVHMFWAQRMVALYPKIKDWIVREFQVDWDEKGLKTLRQESKNKWVFPQLFGSQVSSCADALHLPMDVADDLSGEFWDEFRQVKGWQDKVVRSYEKNLYVETLGGRRRRGAMTKNQVINLPIQGTAADIVTEAMCAVSERAYELDMPEAVPSINIHDDLTFEVSENSVDDVLAMVVPEMCKHRFDYINVPLLVEVSVGTNWANLTEIKKYQSDKIFNLRNPYA